MIDILWNRFPARCVEIRNATPTLVADDSLNTERRMMWNERNRLMALADNGKHAAGERIIRNYGFEGVYVNGGP